jgi:4-amino-4-deoxy-L-arabinose transferase-like glycosyltransferase
MVLLMMAAAYCTVRALERSGGKWLAFAGAALGFAFLAKMLEGLMVMPAIVIVYFVAAPNPIRRRLLHLLFALVAFLASSGWFVLLTLWWPAAARPYIAGSTDNNFMNLVLGYNGFARVLGKNHFGPGSGQIGDSIWRQLNYSGGHGGGGWANQSEGLPRLFTGEFGFEIGWLVPAGLIAFALVLVARGRAPRTDPARAGALLFGGWLLIDGLVLSFMKSMVHPYYCLSLAPAVAGMFAIGVHEMWLHRATWFGRIGLLALILSTGVWSWWILGRNGEWLPALRWSILAVTVAAVVLMVATTAVQNRRRIAMGAALVGLIAALAGPTAYAMATIGQPHQGGGPEVGPASTDHNGMASWGQSKSDPQLAALLRATHTTWSAAIVGSSAAAGMELSTNTSVMAIGGFSGSDPVPTLAEFKDDVAKHKVTYFVINHGRGGAFGRRGHTDITSWVMSNFTPINTPTATVYDLTRPK